MHVTRHYDKRIQPYVGKVHGYFISIRLIPQRERRATGGRGGAIAPTTCGWKSVNGYASGSVCQQ
ncbi:MAG: hypothetical protein Q7R39_08870 [Dehalococcoidia bacterium]|nr:hypothetical protein [Dehalococcoidia bacterium]